MADINFAKYGTPVAKTSSGVDFSKYGTPTASVQNAQTSEKSGGGFVKNLVGAPLTMLARPVQAIAELAGAKSEDVDRVTSKLTGGLVAPVPQNSADVEKDVGRGIQTAALGLESPVAAGAALGAGSSLEQGNKLFSAQTAIQTALGGAGGKVLDLIGKPILDFAGKYIGKITPQTIIDVAGKGSKAIAEFAAQHEILPKEASNAINSGAKAIESAADKPFEMIGQGLKKTGNAVVDLAKKEYPNLSLTEGKFNQAKVDAADTYRKLLPFTPTEKLKEANLFAKTGDDAASTAVKHGISLGSEEAPQHIQDVSNLFENATDKAKANEHGYFNVDEIEKNAHAQIDEKIASETSRQTAKDKITKEIDAIIKANKGSSIKGANGENLVKSDVVERLRKTGNSWTNFNSADPEKVGQSTGYALSNAVRDQVDKEGTFPAYREANKEWGKVLHLQETLGNFEAKGKTFKVPGGLSGSISRKILSGAFGYHLGGGAGAVLAELGSEYGAKILANPELRTYFDRRVIEAYQGKTPTPEVITRLEQQIKEYIDKQSNLKALPAPSYMPMGPRTPSEPGAVVSQAKKNPVSVNPKTGRFQISYNSGNL